MKKIILVSLMALMGLYLTAQTESKVVGVWLTQDSDSQVTISKDSKGKFNGKLTWIKDPLKDGKPKVDDKNPDKKLQSRPMLGLNLLNGFEFNSKSGEWENGTIYDPKSGKTYKCLMWFDKDPDVLSVKGYIGFSLIGREVKWTRSK